MPVTFAHPAAVVPLRRLGLPVSALVVGSMVPDLPLLAPLPVSYEFTHSVPGVLLAGPVLAVVVLAVWVLLVRDALVDLAPDDLRWRLAPTRSLSGREWSLVVPAALVGATTHVVWDAFTHRGRWGTELVPWLGQDHLGLAGHRWAQYGSGVVGSTVLLVVGLAWLRGRDLVPRRRQVPSMGPRSLGLAGVVVVVVAVAAAVPEVSEGLYPVGYALAITGMATTVTATFVLAVLWRVLRARSATDRSASRPRG